MKLGKIYNSNKPVISFEVFPPDNDEKIQELYSEIKILMKCNPQFISLTYGAGGKNNENYQKVLKALKTDLKADVMPHFTCMCSGKSFIEENLEFLKSAGIENILALRGDIPQEIKKICTDFCHANELVEYLKKKTDFSIAVAGYPETHLESASVEDDIKYLKQKVDAGAEVIITQMFFDNEKYFQFCEHAQKAGINVPVIPGIMPVISNQQLLKMTKLARITIPKTFKEKLEKHSDNKAYMKELGIEFATAQCQALLDKKVKGLHFFTLNKSYSTVKILENIL